MTIYLSTLLPSDGSDAGPALRAALTANPGATFVVDGSWRIASRASRNAVLILASGTRLVGNGEGRLEYVRALDPHADDTIRMVTLAQSAEGVEVRGLRLAHRSGRTSKEQNHAVFIYGGQRFGVVADVRVEVAEGGDGVYLGNGTSDWLVERCHVQDHARSAFVFAGSGADRGNLQVRNCTADWSADFPYKGGRLIDFETTGRDIIGIEVVGCSGPGAIDTHLAKGSIRGCTSGQHFHVRSRGLTIDSCIVREDRPGFYGLRFTREQAVEVTRCSLRVGYGSGLYLENIAAGGVPWAATGHEVYLRGSGNDVLLGTPTAKPVARFYGARNPEDIIEDPTVWVKA